MNTPWRRGIERVSDANLRSMFASLKSLCEAVGLDTNKEVISSAVVAYQRFFALKSYSNHDSVAIVSAALLVAAKYHLVEKIKSTGHHVSRLASVIATRLSKGSVGSTTYEEVAEGLVARYRKSATSSSKFQSNSGSRSSGSSSTRVRRGLRLEELLPKVVAGKRNNLQILVDAERLLLRTLHFDITGGVGDPCDPLGAVANLIGNILDEAQLASKKMKKIKNGAMDLVMESSDLPLCRL